MQLFKEDLFKCMNMEVINELYWPEGTQKTPWLLLLVFQCGLFK